jgi:hypothetical protein
MQASLNIFEENWMKKVNGLWEKAKNNRRAYIKFIDELEHRFKSNPLDHGNRVRIYVENLRRILWPADQFDSNPSARNTISDETFKLLRELSNFEKFSEHYNKLSTQKPILKTTNPAKEV